jgi:pyruvate dehydrogenase E2 component (dihydrolipoamide acetyltransferase)
MVGAASTFSTAGVLVGGAVTPRVVAAGGQPVVRPMMTATLSGDHGVWDGRAAAKFLAGVRRELESPASDEPPG